MSGCEIVSFKNFKPTENKKTYFSNKFFMIMIPRNCEGTIQIDNLEFELQSGRIFFINYDQTYKIKNCHSPEGKILLFTKSFYNHIYTGNKLIKSDTILTTVPSYVDVSNNNIEIANVFEQIALELDKSKNFKKEIVCLLLKVFMLNYIRSYGKKISVTRPLDHKKEVVERFVQLVNLHYKEVKSTAIYAKKLNITANYLNVLVKKSTNITAQQTIKNRTILEAERLLLHSTLSVTEIAYELGFSDNSHFGKYFKSEKGVSPNGFRNSHQI